MSHNKTDLYHAGAVCGRNSAVGGYFNMFPIPFGKSAFVIVRTDPLDCKKGCCGSRHLNVRGTENLPVVLPGSGIPLPTLRGSTCKNTRGRCASQQTTCQSSPFPRGTGSFS